MSGAAPILTVDVGTSSLRAILFAAGGRILSAAQERYTYLEPEPSAMEQDPAALWRSFYRATRACLRTAGATRLAALSISTYLHSIMAVDGQGRALTALLLWGDGRAAPQAAALAARDRGHALARATGCPLHASYPLSKLRFLAERRPALWRRARAFWSAKALLLARVVGRPLEDEAVASASGLWDLRARRWSAAALAAAGVAPAMLPEVAPVDAIVGKTTARIVAETGIPQGTPVLAGSGDGMLANLGAGAVAAGDLCVTVGTSAAMRLVVPAAATDGEGKLWCYVFDRDRFIVGGASNNGGHALAWCRDTFLQGRAEDDLGGFAPPASPLFFPFLGGERAPDWDASMSGALVGFRHELSGEAIYLALVRGLCYNLRRIFERLEKAGGPVRRIIASGGGFRSRLFTQTLADVLGRPLLVPAELEASSLGAYALAATALGGRPRPRVRARVLRPDARRHEDHAPYYEAFTQGVAELTPTWHRLAR